MASAPAATISSTKIALAMPHDMNHRSCTRPGPVKSGVDNTVRPTRSSTGLRASLTSPANQSLMDLVIRPPMSKKPGWLLPPRLSCPDAPGGTVGVVGNGSAGAVVGDVLG